MRGKGHRSRKKSRRTRITPAYAGKSHAVSSTSPMKWDHPRVCGEKWPAVTGSQSFLGSPPRMRGKVVRIVWSRLNLGITPAYAGKRKNLNARTGQKKDHPRVCGEKYFSPFSSPHHLGSPPRMRGKEHIAEPTFQHPGITPAYAGKSWRAGTDLWHRRDHPRVCGEKFTFFVFCPYVLGSPPRMRGKAHTRTRNII